MGDSNKDRKLDETSSPENGISGGFALSNISTAAEAFRVVHTIEDDRKRRESSGMLPGLEITNGSDSGRIDKQNSIGFTHPRSGSNPFGTLLWQENSQLHSAQVTNGVIYDAGGKAIGTANDKGDIQIGARRFNVLNASFNAVFYGTGSDTQPLVLGSGKAKEGLTGILSAPDGRTQMIIVGGNILDRDGRFRGSVASDAANPATKDLFIHFDSASGREHPSLLYKEHEGLIFTGMENGQQRTFALDGNAATGHIYLKNESGEPVKHQIRANMVINSKGEQVALFQAPKIMPDGKLQGGSMIFLNTQYPNEIPLNDFKGSVFSIRMLGKAGTVSDRIVGISLGPLKYAADGQPTGSPYLSSVEITAAHNQARSAAFAKYQDYSENAWIFRNSSKLDSLHRDLLRVRDNSGQSAALLEKIAATGKVDGAIIQELRMRTRETQFVKDPLVRQRERLDATAPSIEMLPQDTTTINGQWRIPVRNAKGEKTGVSVYAIKNGMIHAPDGAAVGQIVNNSREQGLLLTNMVNPVTKVQLTRMGDIEGSVWKLSFPGWENKTKSVTWFSTGNGGIISQQDLFSRASQQRSYVRSVYEQGGKTADGAKALQQALRFEDGFRDRVRELAESLPTREDLDRLAVGPRIHSVLEPGVKPQEKILPPKLSPAETERMYGKLRIGSDVFEIRAGKLYAGKYDEDKNSCGEFRNNYSVRVDGQSIALASRDRVLLEFTIRGTGGQMHRLVGLGSGAMTSYGWQGGLMPVDELSRQAREAYNSATGGNREYFKQRPWLTGPLVSATVASGAETSMKGMASSIGRHWDQMNSQISTLFEKGFTPGLMTNDQIDTKVAFVSQLASMLGTSAAGAREIAQLSGQLQGQISDSAVVALTTVLTAGSGTALAVGANVSRAARIASIGKNLGSAGMQGAFTSYALRKSDASNDSANLVAGGLEGITMRAGTELSKLGQAASLGRAGRGLLQTGEISLQAAGFDVAGRVRSGDWQGFDAGNIGWSALSMLAGRKAGHLGTSGLVRLTGGDGIAGSLKPAGFFSIKIPDQGGAANLVRTVIDAGTFGSLDARHSVQHLLAQEAAGKIGLDPERNFIRPGSELYKRQIGDKENEKIIEAGITAALQGVIPAHFLHRQSLNHQVRAQQEQPTRLQGAHEARQLVQIDEGKEDRRGRKLNTTDLSLHNGKDLRDLEKWEPLARQENMRKFIDMFLPLFYSGNDTFTVQSLEATLNDLGSKMGMGADGRSAAGRASDPLPAVRVVAGNMREQGVFDGATGVIKVQEAHLSKENARELALTLYHELVHHGQFYKAACLVIDSVAGNSAVVNQEQRQQILARLEKETTKTGELPGLKVTDEYLGRILQAREERYKQTGNRMLAGEERAVAARTLEAWKNYSDGNYLGLRDEAAAVRRNIERLERSSGNETDVRAVLGRLYQRLAGSEQDKQSGPEREDKARLAKLLFAGGTIPPEVAADIKAWQGKSKDWDVNRALSNVVRALDRQFDHLNQQLPDAFRVYVNDQGKYQPGASLENSAFACTLRLADMLPPLMKFPIASEPVSGRGLRDRDARELFTYLAEDVNWRVEQGVNFDKLNHLLTGLVRDFTVRRESLKNDPAFQQLQIVPDSSAKQPEIVYRKKDGSKFTPICRDGETLYQLNENGAISKENIYDLKVEMRLPSALIERIASSKDQASRRLDLAQLESQLYKQLSNLYLQGELPALVKSSASHPAVLASEIRSLSQRNEQLSELLRQRIFYDLNDRRLPAITNPEKGHGASTKKPTAVGNSVEAIPPKGPQAPENQGTKSQGVDAEGMTGVHQMDPGIRETAKLVSEAAAAVGKLIDSLPGGTPVVLLERDMGPLVAVLRAQGRQVQSFHWSRLQHSDKSTHEHWLKEIPPNAVVIDTGYMGNVVSAIKAIDPTIKPYLLSSARLLSGKTIFPELLEHASHEDIVKGIERVPKTTGRCSSYTAKGTAICRPQDKDPDERLLSPKDTLDYREKLLNALNLPQSAIERYRNFASLTPEQRVGLSSSTLSQHFEQVKRARYDDVCKRAALAGLLKLDQLSNAQALTGANADEFQNVLRDSLKMSFKDAEARKKHQNFINERLSQILNAKTPRQP
jgi:hypothetical protein